MEGTGIVKFNGKMMQVDRFLHLDKILIEDLERIVDRFNADPKMIKSWIEALKYQMTYNYKTEVKELHEAMSSGY